MKVRILQIISDTVVDGPGLRTSVYFAGCKHRCPGCHNPESWDMNGGYEVEVEDLVNIILSYGNNKITLSGGDPLYQLEGVLEVLRKLHDKGITDIWLYTGFTIDQIDSEILRYVDTVVDGPFVQSLKNTDLQFRGSTNQNIIKVCTL